MKTISAAEMRELDRRTIKELGTSGEILMRRAGQGIAEIAQKILIKRNGRAILLIAGTGNNGGDVFAAATKLAHTGPQLDVWICGLQQRIKGDAKTHLEKMMRVGIVPKEVHDINDLLPSVAPDLIVDGLLGVGSKGAPRGFMASLIDWINRREEHSFVLSIDLPSGVDADRGVAEGSAVKADLTVTVGQPKTGLIRPEAIPFVGQVKIVDIGIPTKWIEETEGCSHAMLIDRSDLWVPRRKRDSHKGIYGHVLLIGGSVGYTGAIAMAARAALRSGAGLVSVLTPKEVYPIVAQAAGPEVMVHPLHIEKFSTLFSAHWKTCDAVLIGPGLGHTDKTRAWVNHLLKTCEMPLVLDADALYVTPKQIAEANGPVLLTPHSGEFERLFGHPVTDRWTQAREAAEQTGQTIILKGAGTVIAHSGKKLAINLTGNPGMATGGSGDILAGLLVGLLGKGQNVFDAAMSAVYLHGLAGDLSAEITTQEAWIATDLIDVLPDAFRLLHS